jgi:hypothetical protein
LTVSVRRPVSARQTMLKTARIARITDNIDVLPLSA